MFTTLELPDGVFKLSGLALAISWLSCQYTNSANRLNYLVGSQAHTVTHYDS